MAHGQWPTVDHWLSRIEHGDGVYNPFSQIPGYLDPAKVRQEAAALNPHLVADMSAASGIASKATEKPPEVKQPKPIDATSLDDYRRGVAKVFDSYRLLP